MVVVVVVVVVLVTMQMPMVKHVWSLCSQQRINVFSHSVPFNPLYGCR
jgi:hypothetical protein